MDDRANGPETSAAEWRQMYFLGLSKRPLDQIKPDEAQVGGLLSVIGLTAVISSGTAIEPQYLINEKGTTPWLAMYALVRTNDPEALALIADGRLRWAGS